MSDIVDRLYEIAALAPDEQSAALARAAEIIERHRAAFRHEARSFGHSDDEVELFLARLEAGE